MIKKDEYKIYLNQPLPDMLDEMRMTWQCPKCKEKISVSVVWGKEIAEHIHPKYEEIYTVLLKYRKHVSSTLLERITYRGKAISDGKNVLYDLMVAHCREKHSGQ